MRGLASTSHPAHSAVLGALAHRWLQVAALAMVAFHLHLLCDLAGSGPGWPLTYLWPFSRQELEWSGQWDLASWQNSCIGLAVTLLVLSCAVWVRRTAVELFWVKADQAVVAAIRARFMR